MEGQVVAYAPPCVPRPVGMQRKVLRRRGAAADRERDAGPRYMKVLPAPVPAPPPHPAQEAASPALVSEVEVLAYHADLSEALRAEVDDTLTALREVQGRSDLDAAVEGMDEASPASLYAMAAMASTMKGEEEFSDLLLREAASLGHICAGVEMAARVFPTPEALAALDQPNVKDHPRAQLLISVALEEGAAGVPCDSGMALQWLQRSAASLYPPATFALGMRHEQQRDFTSAYRLYLQGADRGHVDSQLSLGKLYLLGRDLLSPPQSGETLEKAEQWLRKAARSGSTEASYLLERTRVGV